MGGSLMLRLQRSRAQPLGIVLRPWRGFRRNCSGVSAAGGLHARALLRPPTSGEGAVELNGECGLDLELNGVPTVSIIGPSRRGKSVLGCLLAGGQPGLFAQSHSSFRAMTSGTHVVETRLPPEFLAGGEGEGRLRIVDTEGLSHIGRSRRSEALVRQLLISTYLTSSWVVWLDTEVLSSSFFNMMWLVHDYVVDILKVGDAAGTRLPRLLYVRTQETELQQREWSGEFADFGAFFQAVLASHEDAFILEQMFAAGGLCGHSLPVWTVEDLECFESGHFWRDGHASPFKSSVQSLRRQLLQPAAAAAAGAALESAGGPPLLALSDLGQHLPKIAKLEAFDPRDHEAAKVLRARDHLRASYGRLCCYGAEGKQEGAEVDLVGIANLFDPEDRDVRQLENRIDLAVRARFEKKCKEMRVEPEIAYGDKEVNEVLGHFDRAATVFSAGCDAYVVGDTFSELGILRLAIENGLDADTMATLLRQRLEEADTAFLARVALPPDGLRKLRLRERASWRIDDCIARLRRRSIAGLVLRESPKAESDEGPSPVWRLGEWLLSEPPRDGKQVRMRRPREYALWTDGLAWALYLERPDGSAVVHQRGTLPSGATPVPLPV
eukprot:TRINITY_DN19486_c1_g1_i1.p1 TRINITY_DN19486_c1_g1~~TRINITY_DN19486_c1_g1_i1.p1  ORF type:complete len:641 (-),score=141.16 TRINITY_DN19486_c1_g1_i1:456-2285(-)